MISNWLMVKLVIPCKRLTSRNSNTNIAVVTSTGVIVVTSHETNAIATRGAKCTAV